MNASGPAVSLAIHAAIIGAFLAGSLLRLPDPPVDPPSVELVIGTGADTGGAAAPEPPPPPPASPVAPSAPPTAAAVPAAPPVQASAPPPPVEGTVAAAPAAPATPAPQPVPPARAATPTQAASPAPPPMPTSTPSASPTFNVRLGSGIAAPIAQIEDTGLVHPAKSEIGNLPPDYPPEAAQRHEQGTVLLGVRVGVDGRVMEVRVMRSSGSRWLDAAARDRVLTWHFRPATRNGSPVGDIVDVPIRFVE